MRTRYVAQTLSAMLLMVFAVAACGDSGAAEPGDGASTPPGLHIVATTSIVADIVMSMGVETAVVDVLIPNGADPHEFSPSARQVALLQTADLVVANGLGLEAGLTDVLAAAADDGVEVIELGLLADPVSIPSPTEAPGTGESPPDPHVWMDPVRMASAVRALGVELAAVDANGDWEVGAERYAVEMERLDGEIRAQLEPIATDRRKLVTNHQALGYFAMRYGLDIVGVVVPGGTTLAEPSSADLAALVATMRAEGVRAIFAETTAPMTLADAIAWEVGGDVAVVELYTEAFGAPGSGADSLVGLLRTDAELIAEALG